ncbi:Probable plastid-lipid-associated protein 13, chloroplastic [Linum grandiflorum]
MAAATVASSLPSIPAARSRYSSASSSRHTVRLRMPCRAMVQQAAQQGAPAAYAKEMERLSAKESLLLAFKDAGGFESLVTGKTTEVQKIDVNERITGLERLNPTPRPTTSPYLEGRWNFEWFGAGSPGLFAARLLFQRFPSDLANLSNMDVVIKEGKAKATANMKLFYSIESKFTLSSQLTVEGPLRMKEEYVEGFLETPKVIEESLPEQLKGALSQAISTVQQLPVPIRDAIAGGLRVPLTGTFQRLFLISYLDEEILVMRDAAGVPEVLTRLETPTAAIADTVTEYES